MTCQEMILADDVIEIFRNQSITGEDSVPADAGCIVEVDSEIQIVYESPNLFPQVADPIYPYAAIPKCYGLMQDTATIPLQPFDPLALESAGILAIQQQPLSLTGRDVICAFLDTGINYDDLAFRRADGNSRILAIWDQTIQLGTPPRGYLYGSEYLQEEINIALASDSPYNIVSSKDDIGHGSNLVSIAAGSILNNGQGFIGAAPNADIIVVKLKQAKPYLREYYGIAESVPCYAETDILLAIKYLEECRIRFGKPVVICFGLGTSYGGHDGTSILARYIDRVAARRNCVMLVAAGNEGNKSHHMHGIIEQQQTTVEVRVNAGVTAFVLEIWGQIPYIFQAGIRSPSGETIPEIAVRRAGEFVYGFTYESTRIYVNSTLTEQSSGAQMIRLLFDNPTPGIWNILLNRIGNEGTISFHMWLPIANFLTSNVYFLAPNPYTTFTEPAGSQEALSITAYQETNRSIFSAAGRGYTRTDAIKPDIAVPGVNISSIGGKISGTGPATAMAAGAAAQYMQWAVTEGNEPNANTIYVKTFFIRGARRENIPLVPNREWGWGLLDIQNSFRVNI